MKCVNKDQIRILGRYLAKSGINGLMKQGRVNMQSIKL